MSSLATVSVIVIYGFQESLLEYASCFVSGYGWALSPICINNTGLSAFQYSDPLGHISL
jgi:hypothetical protein